VLGDIVEVCGFYHATPRIRFVRKAGAAANLVGEKLDESHVTRAVQAVLSERRLDPTWFTLVPDASGERPGYVLHLELPPGVTLDEAAFATRVDAALSEASYDYARLRVAQQLGPITLKPIAPGSYHAVRQRKVQDGSAEAQLKTAHLTPDADTLPPELR
jgi:hypothetical protein